MSGQEVSTALRSLVCCLLLLLMALGSCGGCSSLQLNAGYAMKMLGGDRRHSAVVNSRILVGEGDARLFSKHSVPEVLFDLPVFRIRIDENSGRIGALGLGIYYWAGSLKTITATINLGFSLVDGSWNERRGFGMFSPHLELGTYVRFTKGFGMVLNAGIEYTVRFFGPQDGFFFTTTLGIAFWRSE